MDLETRCDFCGKTPDFCLCESLPSIDHRTKVVILRHPQEQDEELGTAPLLAKALKNCVLRTGLSWPNLSAALYGKGEKPVMPPAPSDWGVLYFGSGPKMKPKTETGRLLALDRKGVPTELRPAGSRPLKGIIVIDGSWSQAKTLWWRNAWLLKVKRLVVMPKQKSLYGNLRREPKRECVSTLESTAIALAEIEQNAKIEQELLKSLRMLLDKVKAKRNPTQKKAATETPTVSDSSADSSSTDEPLY
jgi:DTW domain-containing protein YfiP